MSENPSTPVIPPLTTIYLYLTGSCNLNCRHCWIDPYFEGSPREVLPWSELRKIIVEAKELGLQSVKLTGGEPFLHPQAVEVMYGLQELELGVTVETNGTLIGERQAKALKDTSAFFSISIDGPTAELHDDLRGVKGALKRTLKGIEYVRAEGLSFQVIACLHRGNRHAIVEMMEFSRSLGASSLKINPITGTARADEMESGGELLTIPEILEAYREMKTAVPQDFQLSFDLPPAFLGLKEFTNNSCGTCGILNLLGVLHDGSAGLCGIGEHIEGMNFGDLRQLGVRKVWEETETLKLLRDGVPDKLKGVCGMCLFKSYCLGKCVANTYYETGDLLGPFGFCQQAYDQGLFPNTRLVDG